MMGDVAFLEHLEYEEARKAVKKDPGKKDAFRHLLLKAFVANCQDTIRAPLAILLETSSKEKTPAEWFKETKNEFFNVVNDWNADIEGAAHLTAATVWHMEFHGDKPVPIFTTQFMQQTLQDPAVLVASECCLKMSPDYLAFEEWNKNNFSMEQVLDELRDHYVHSNFAQTVQYQPIGIRFAKDFQKDKMLTTLPFYLDMHIRNHATMLESIGNGPLSQPYRIRFLMESVETDEDSTAVLQFAKRFANQHLCISLAVAAVSLLRLLRWCSEVTYYQVWSQIEQGLNSGKYIPPNFVNFLRIQAGKSVRDCIYD